MRCIQPIGFLSPENMPRWTKLTTKIGITSIQVRSMIPCIPETTRFLKKKHRYTNHQFLLGFWAVWFLLVRDWFVLSGGAPDPELIVFFNGGTQKRGPTYFFWFEEKNMGLPGMKLTPINKWSYDCYNFITPWTVDLDSWRIGHFPWWWFPGFPSKIEPKQFEGMVMVT